MHLPLEPAAANRVHPSRNGLRNRAGTVSRASATEYRVRPGCFFTPTCPAARAGLKQVVCRACGGARGLLAGRAGHLHARGAGSYCETVELNGGRREWRTCTVPASVRGDLAAWPGLCSLIRRRTERRGPHGRQRAVSYYISSRPVEVEALAGTGPRPLGRGERPAPHPERAVPGGRLSFAHGLALHRAALHRAALNMVRAVQQNCSADVSISLLRDRIGRHLWILAAALP